MVSGFFTSPCDHSRIFSGEAREIRIAENDSGSLGFSKKLKMSFIVMIGHSRKRTRATTSLRGHRGGRRRRGGRRWGARLGRHLARHQLDGRLLLARGVRILDQLDVEAQ